ncbi:MAG: alpha-ketoglutarate decarboxylase [Lutibacter sp.]|uniref:alpha-ketoglutarate decarboxylase n=1 Tax=Lutibacter sp. TaxID=1925666 RepID=UPI0019D9FADD|nr:alpha-ketoglutarate decarboxylase [Lutibacter sp.]NOR28719.1 alpha-ketoglutarate decarboxylase [Lutibacter sp.]
MHKIKILLLFIIFVNINLFGQNSDLEQHRFIDDVRFGGGINIGVGSSYSTFAISPSVIYDFSNTFSAGLSFTYIYVKTKSIINPTTNHYGGSVLALYKPIKNLQLTTEFEQLKVNQKYSTIDVTDLKQNALYIGAEYVTGNFSMGLRYDILFDKTTNIIYSSALTPVFRVYF